MTNDYHKADLPKLLRHRKNKRNSADWQETTHWFLRGASCFSQIQPPQLSLQEAHGSLLLYFDILYFDDLLYFDIDAEIRAPLRIRRGCWHFEGRFPATNSPRRG